MLRCNLSGPVQKAPGRVGQDCSERPLSNPSQEVNAWIIWLGMIWPRWLYGLNDPRDRWWADDKVFHAFGAALPGRLGFLREFDVS